MASSSGNISRTVRGLLTVIFALGLLLSLEVFSRFLLEGSVEDGPRHMVQVSIPEGTSVAEIAEILHRQGLIEHPLLFRYAVRIMGADTKIQAGSMQLASGQSLFDLINNLTHTKALGIPVTLREGITSMDVAAVLQSRLSVDSTTFMSVVQDTLFIRELGLDGPTLEGYLYPDTYYIASGTDPRRIARRMVANFFNHLPDSAVERSVKLGFSLHEIITLASIIEWETFTRSEARTISSVYHNRIRRGMPLQADPTVSYALGKGPARLYYSDLKVDSPYNTYRNPGLPPGPINNPRKYS
ncbi:endolytic transglycosylase MltG, partial [candidate division KSB1 bacterium]